MMNTIKTIGNYEIVEDKGNYTRFFVEDTRNSIMYKHYCDTKEEAIALAASGEKFELNCHLEIINERIMEAARLESRTDIPEEKTEYNNRYDELLKKAFTTEDQIKAMEKIELEAEREVVQIKMFGVTTKTMLEAQEEDMMDDLMYSMSLISDAQQMIKHEEQARKLMNQAKWFIARKRSADRESNK